MGQRIVRRMVVMPIFPDVQILDVTGPIEVFNAATRFLEAERRDGGYDCALVGANLDSVRSSGGIRIVPDRTLRSLAASQAKIDTLMVPGGVGSRRMMEDRRTVEWIRRRARSSRRVASICTGAGLLAAAGLLDGKRATTHWAYADELAQRFPQIVLEADSIHLRDGNVYTSAGVTAGMDLALALVEEDYGREVALTVARWLVMFLKRPGGQSQFSVHLASQQAAREPLRDVQSWVVDNLPRRITVEGMATLAGMSPRNFARVFHCQVGITPARFVERARVELARRRLEESRAGIDEIAENCGFGSPETMRRAFLRNVRVAPADYRKRFQTNRNDPNRSATTRESNRRRQG